MADGRGLDAARTGGGPGGEQLALSRSLGAVLAEIGLLFQRLHRGALTQGRQLILKRQQARLLGPLTRLLKLFRSELFLLLGLLLGLLLLGFFLFRLLLLGLLLRRGRRGFLALDHLGDTAGHLLRLLAIDLRFGQQRQQQAEKQKHPQDDLEDAFKPQHILGIVRPGQYRGNLAWDL